MPARTIRLGAFGLGRAAATMLPSLVAHPAVRLTAAADVLTAAANGNHAIVEKPMALTLEECRAMTDAAERNGVVLVVGHSHGFDPSIKLIRELVASGEVGALRMMTSLDYTNFLYRPRRPEELDTAQGCGIMFNQIPHQLDIVRVIDGGPLQSVHAVTRSWDRTRHQSAREGRIITLATEDRPHALR
jgi:phthalate 4,5-cis-dihydrodiol dehydrogenase